VGTQVLVESDSTSEPIRAMNTQARNRLLDHRRLQHTTNLRDICGLRPPRPLVPHSRCIIVATSSFATNVQTPKKLPRPPDKTSIESLVPWLAKLAMGETEHLWRIAFSMSLMVVSKCAGLMCPWLIKQAVDSLAVGNTAHNALFLPHAQWATSVGSSLGVPLSLQAAGFAVLCFGAADMIKNVAKELQMPIFLPVTQAVGRRVSFHTFMHMLYLDVRYHIEKRTGRISRVLERGPRAIHQIYRAVIFIFLPVMVELIAVTYLLSKAFSPVVGGVIGATFLFYCAWSIALTQLSTEARREVNEADNLVTSKVGQLGFTCPLNFMILCLCTSSCTLRS
jgi:hypothetical protein